MRGEVLSYLEALEFKGSFGVYRGRLFVCSLFLSHIETRCWAAVVLS